MEEMKQQLYELQNLTYQFDYINGLMYTLREALRNNDELMSFQYTMASAYFCWHFTVFKKKQLVVISVLVQHLLAQL